MAALVCVHVGAVSFFLCPAVAPLLLLRRAPRDTHESKIFSFFLLLRKEVQPSRRAPPFVGAESNQLSSEEISTPEIGKGIAQQREKKRKTIT
jgi:hypothetical protein